jgi:phospholipid/cholesterol/gamma-HCH transport system substrate-binding protein
MSQGKQLTWTELRVGVFVLVGLAVLAVGIVYVTGASSLTPKYRLRAYLSEVEGLQVGAPVRIDGVEVGSIDTIHLNQQTGDKSRNIEVGMRLNREFEKNVRTDSLASLITEGVLGNRYMTISRGFASESIPPNGEVRASQELAIKDVVQRGADLVQNLGVLSDQVRGIVDSVKKGQGTIGKLLVDDQLYRHLNQTAAHIESIAASTRAGEGTLGKLVASDELYDHASRTIGHAEAILSDVREQKGSLGKFVYDPAVYDSARKFLDRGNDVLEGVQQGKGTLGKLTKDDALYSNLRDSSANIKEATQKLNSREGTLGKTFTDPELYDNLAGVTSDMRKLISDFRQNPKKFLHVKFSIF